MFIIKKDGREEKWDPHKIFNAVEKSAERVNTKLSKEFYSSLSSTVYSKLKDKTDVKNLHKIVENSLQALGECKVADSYRSFRNYKTNFVDMMAEIYSKANMALKYGDRENANFESTLISTKQALIRGYLTKELYKSNYLTQEELEAIDTGYIYIHDLRDLIFNGFNCIDETGFVTIRYKSKIETLRFMDIKDKFGLKEGITKLPKGVQILSRNGWTSLDGVSIRKLKENEPLYVFTMRNGLKLKTTSNHRIPVVTSNGEEVVKYAKDITKEDCVVTQAKEVCTDNNSVIDLLDYVSDELSIGNVDKLQKYINYKFGTSGQQLFKDLDIKTDRTFRGLTVSQFKKLKQLVDIPYDVYNSLTVFSKGSSTRLPLLLSVTKELATVFGCIFADGCVSGSTKHGSYQVTFSNTNEELLNKYINCLSVVFPDVKINLNKPTKGSTTPCTHIRVTNKVIWDLFKKFKTGSNNILIPDFIMHNTEEVKYSFLGAAYDCDGCVGLQCKYTTVCEVYANQFVLLLEGLGYSPTLNIRNTAGSVYKNKEVVGTRNYDTFNVIISNVTDQTKLKDKIDSFKFKRYDIKERVGVKHDTSRIKSIELEYKDSYVYDVETGDSWFIVNGYVVHNCCLFDMGSVLENGFEMANLKYKEPTNVLSCLQVIGDVTLSASAQQFGGFTIDNIDKILVKYIKKSIVRYGKEAVKYKVSDPYLYAINKTTDDLDQGFQSLEMKLNSVTSSRGDYSFVTLTFGNMDVPEDREYQMMACKAILKNRKKDNPVVFPKLVHLFSWEQYENVPEAKELFDLSIDCSCKALYPDYLAIDTVGKVAEYYKKGKKVVSPMGEQYKIA